MRFIYFLNNQEVRVGCSEGGLSSLELEEGGSPPARPSPPATPAPQCDLVPPPLLARSEPLELQLDYWLVSDTLLLSLELVLEEGFLTRLE